jgi:hypothetical protein
LEAYLGDKRVALNKWLRRVYPLVLRWLAPAPDGAAPQMAPAVSPLEQWWEKAYQRADALSVLYGESYRSSYVVVIALSFAAFILSTIGAIALTLLTEIYDLLLLILIVDVVWLNQLAGWQEKWITYRLLAELCRKQFMLSPLGRTLPGAQVSRTSEDVAEDHEGTKLPREAWVGWYFLALMRCAPTPDESAVRSKQRALALGRSLIAEQSDYHRRRQVQSKTADTRLAFAVKLFFGLTMFTVVARIIPPFLAHYGGADLSGLNAAPWLAIESVLSAATAACVALRTYSEFALMARHSLHMREIMAESAVELNAIDVTLPLASRDLGAALHRLAISMMQEVGGWAQLFRLKTVETA